MKRSIKFFIAFAIFGAQAMAPNAILAWDGTSSEEAIKQGTYYEISNAEQLKWYADQVSEGSSIDGKLVSDIDLSNQKWSPIGTTSNEFNSIFDGQNHKITNFNIESTSAWQGLFAKSSGTIKNVNLTGTINTKGNGIGSIVAWNNGGIVENCYSDVEIVSTRAAADNIGGIIGQSSDGSEITNNTFVGKVDASLENGGSKKAAGIVANSIRTKVEGNVNKGEIIGANGSLSSHVGGIIGYQTSTGTGGRIITNNNINLGEVKANSTNAIVGGIIGNGSALSSMQMPEFLILNNYNAGKLTSNGKVAGIIANLPNEDQSITKQINNYTIADATDYDEGLVSLEDMKSSEFVTKLNSNDGKELNVSINEGALFIFNENGYPTLVREKAKEEEINDEADLKYLEDAKKELDNKWFKLRPVFSKDNNVNTVLHQALTGYNYGDLNVSIKDTANTDYVKEDGAINYFYEDPNSFQPMWFKSVKVNFLLTKNNVSAEYSINAVIHWDLDKLLDTTKTEIMDKITEDSIKGENEDLDNIKSNLVLPKVVDNKKWSIVSWESSDSKVIEIDSSNQGSSATLFDPYIGKVKKSIVDKNVTLNVKVVNNLTSSNEKPIELTKSFDVIVKGQGEELQKEMQKQLDENYVESKLTDMVTKQQLDINNVVNDIQLVIPDKTGITNSDSYQFTAQSKDESLMKVNGYRAVVYRPLPNDTKKKVTFTVTMRHREHNIAVSKDFTVTILPLVQTEIDNEVNLMQQAKDNYFNGLNKNGNKDVKHIVKNLSPFQQVKFDEKNNLKWIYNYNEKDETGITPVAIDLSHPSEKWNLFKSSNDDIVEHEVLRIVKPKEDSKVTIQSTLSSYIYEKYATRYPDVKQFKKLSRQDVSIELNVIGETSAQEQIDKENKDAARAIQDMISKLPEAKTLSVLDELALNEANNKLNESSQDIQDLVNKASKDKLNELNVKLKELKDTYDVRKSELETAMKDHYTLDRLYDIDTKVTIDPNKVMNDMQLLLPREIKLSNVNGTSLTGVSSNENLLKINTYRGVVYRPLEQQGDKKVEFTITLRDKIYDIDVKKSFEITIGALTQKEIDDELALMADVKANFFNGINNDANTDVKHIKKDLSAFKNVNYDKDGKLNWLYTAPRDVFGIRTTKIPGTDWMFSTSDEKVISHVLLKVKQPSEDKVITVKANLNSYLFGKLAEIHPESKDLQKLSNQLVSVDLNVIGRDSAQEKQDIQDRENADKLDKMIEELQVSKPLSAEDVINIEKISNLFNELSDDAKSLVKQENKDNLASLVSDVQVIKDEKAAKIIEEKINSLPELTNLKLSDKKKVLAVYEEYIKASDDVKSRISKVATDKIIQLKKKADTLKEVVAQPKNKVTKSGNNTYYYTLVNNKYVMNKKVSCSKTIATTTTYNVRNGKFTGYTRFDYKGKKVVKKQYRKYTNTGKISNQKIYTLNRKNKYINTYNKTLTYKKNRVYSQVINRKGLNTNKYTNRTKNIYRTNGKKANVRVFKYSKGKITSRYEYVYNRSGVLKSNKSGKAYRYQTTYRKGKAQKTFRKQYNAKGKLSKNKTVSKRTAF